MKKLAYKAFIVLFCALLIIPVIPIMKTDAAEPSIYYCREALKSLPDSEKLLFAYDKLAAGVEASETEIKVYNGADNLTLDEIKIVFEAYRRDHAEHFWLGGSYSYSTFAGTIVNISPEYTMSGVTLENAKLEFESAMEGILSQISPSMSDYEKEKKIHDLLAARVTYVDGANAHNAYGALVEGLAVCEGYAEALQCLLHRVGIQSLLVYGSSDNPSSGVNEPHAWNMVKINGEYYHVDLTWNDQNSHLYYAYFNQTDAVISEDHIIDASPFPVPSCTATENNYFEKEGNIISSYTVASVAQIFSDNNLVLRAFISGDKDDFITWITSNMQPIAQEIGISSAFGYSYSSIGNEVIVIIDTCLHQSLTFVPTVEATCTQNGIYEHYLCSCGKIFTDNGGNNEILDTSSLVLVAGHMWTSKIEDDAHLKSAPTSCAEYYTYYYGCEECDAISPDRYFESNRTLPHSPVLVERVEPTCSTHGKAAYYQCSCGKYFADAAGTQRITNINAYGRLDRASHGELNALGKCPNCGESVELTATVTTLWLIVGFALIIAPAIVVNLKRLKKLFKKKSRAKTADELSAEDFDEE